MKLYPILVALPLAIAACAKAPDPNQYIKHGADANSPSSGDATAKADDESGAADQTTDSGSAQTTADDAMTTTNASQQTMQASTTTDAMSTQTTTMNEPPPFNPCPTDSSPCKIMPYGDSITFGYASSDGGGYRKPLLVKAWAANQKITFVGPQSSGPAKVDGKDFVKANAGYSGYTIQKSSREGIMELCDDLMKKYQPHIVTLQIGTNDIGTNNDLANAPTRLGNLLDKIIAGNPNALVVVAQIVPTTDDNKNKLVKAYNDAIPALVKQRADAGKHVIMVDMYTAIQAHADYKTSLMSDSLHPRDAGYQVMADVWYEALKGYLK